jgi:hypothetical protein
VSRGKCLIIAPIISPIAAAVAVAYAPAANREPEDAYVAKSLP